MTKEKILNILESAKDKDGEIPMSLVRKAFEKLPERKKGKWIYGEDEHGIDGYHCDKCGFFVPWDYTHKLIDYIEDYNYCPRCDADMSELHE